MGDDERIDRSAVARLCAAGLVLGTAAIATATGWVDWSEVGEWLRPHLVVTALSVVAVLLAGGALRRLVPRQWWPRWLVSTWRPDRRATPLSWWMVAAAATVVASVTWGATTALLHEADGAKDPAAARVDAIKTGLSIGAGTGGVFALLLAIRRQWHQELTATDTTLDAESRRITELYTKAVEQLGSDKAPVRLGGLYALERVAQDNSGQRQTIVNVVCAYLRMPYTLPAEQAPAQDAPESEQVRFEQRAQERQVRLTAQRILAGHLRPGGYFDRPVVTFWPDIDVDLSGATLTNFTLADCHLDTAQFTDAHFIGGTEFDGARFTRSASFDGAWFVGDVSFDWAEFVSGVRFDKARFAGNAAFGGARFANVQFTDTKFNGGAGFDGARFIGSARFDRARFTGDTRFDRARFTSSARFDRAEFVSSAGFKETRFTGDARFGGTEFAIEIDVNSPGPDGVAWCWVRLDVSDAIAQRRTWPAGSAVVATIERPRPDAEGKWGLLVKQPDPDPS